MNRLKFLLWLVPVFLLGVGCAATRKPVSKEEKPEVKLVEDFDPMTLTDDDFIVTPRYKEPRPGEKYTFARADSTHPVPGDSGNVKMIHIQGYRIQVGAVTNQEDAVELRRQAMLNFGDANVYLIFEPPYYKIRVGDFERRRDAESFQKKAVKLGYRDAWIVRTVIEKKVRQ